MKPLRYRIRLITKLPYCALPASHISAGAFNGLLITPQGIYTWHYV